jgi:hypothetical protein
MLVFYTEAITERLKYICDFILKEQLGLEYIVTNDLSSFQSSEHLVINYSHQNIPKDHLHLQPHTILFEENICQQNINCFSFKSFDNAETSIVSFFKSDDSDFSFDIFGATFFLLSRYEEYLPHEKDMYGRYAHENSIAFKNEFLHIPLINLWLKEFQFVLQQKFNSIKITRPTFKTILTYDIDIAWSFKNKGFIRNIGGFLKSPSVERLLVLLQFKKDPFDSFNFLDSFHKSTNQQALYFFLVAERKGIYDKNISPKNKEMQRLIKNQATQNSIGIHPSWKSNEDESILQREIKTLEQFIQQPIAYSRQHYVKFILPETFHNLIKNNIQKDYSMGYGSINGFRASFAGSFFWFDLVNNKTTALRLYPFSFMDANCFYEQRLSITDSYQELLYYKTICEQNNGLFIPIFHNHFLGSDKLYKGWKGIFEDFISQLP